MGKRVSPTLIGAFVVASFAILIVALIVVGSGRMFVRPVRFICMFQGNLNGLKIGAPVKVRGVQIGTVSEIRLRLDPSEGQVRPDFRGFRLPVIIDLDKSMLRNRGAVAVLDQRNIQDWIKRGMRAQLQVESLLTGLLYIDLDIHKGTRPNFILEPGGPYPEIPTVPTDLAQLQERLTVTLEKLEKIDFEGLANSMMGAADSIKGLAGSPELKTTLESLRVTMTNLNQTLTAAREVLDSANANVGPLMKELRETAQETDRTMEGARVALVKIQQGLDPDSPLIVHLNQTLESLDQTSRSVGELADYLQRNPSALVRGRYVEDRNK